MELKEALQIIKTYQAWRRGETCETLTMDDLGIEPVKIGIALDALIDLAQIVVNAEDSLEDGAND